MKKTNLINFAIRRFHYLMSYLNDTTDVTLANELRNEIENLLDTISFLDKKMSYTNSSLEEKRFSGEGDQVPPQVESVLGSTSFIIRLPQVPGEMAKHGDSGVQEVALRGSEAMLIVEEKNDFREQSYTKASLRAEDSATGR